MFPMMISHLRRLHLFKVLLILIFCFSLNENQKAFSAPRPDAGKKLPSTVIHREPKPTVPKTAGSYLDSYESIEVMATGYTAGIESTGKSPSHPQYGITYSGVKVRKSVVSTIAADTKVFPLGTLLYIPGYGYGIVADTGSAIKGNKIDLFFLNKKEVYTHWGKKKVNVYVLKKGNGKVTEAMLDHLNEMKAFAQHPPLMKIEL
jgi:3D (Asp-Asp-Asp) domain-containing protein